MRLMVDLDIVIDPTGHLVDMLLKPIIIHITHPTKILLDFQVIRVFIFLLCPLGSECPKGVFVVLEKERLLLASPKYWVIITHVVLILPVMMQLGTRLCSHHSLFLFDCKS